jgi:hypothetical protein
MCIQSYFSHLVTLRSMQDPFLIKHILQNNVLKGGEKKKKDKGKEKEKV